MGNIWIAWLHFLHDVRGLAVRPGGAAFILLGVRLSVFLQISDDTGEKLLVSFSQFACFVVEL